MLMLILCLLGHLKFPFILKRSAHYLMGAFSFKEGKLTLNVLLKNREYIQIVSNKG